MNRTFVSSRGSSATTQHFVVRKLTVARFAVPLTVRRLHRRHFAVRHFGALNPSIIVAGMLLAACRSPGTHGGDPPSPTPARLDSSTPPISTPSSSPLDSPNDTPLQFTEAPDFTTLPSDTTPEVGTTTPSGPTPFTSSPPDVSPAGTSTPEIATTPTGTPVTPTPAETTPEEATATPIPLEPALFNEINCENDDWVEVANPNVDGKLDLSGWAITDDLDAVDHWYTFVPGTILDPLELRVLYKADDDTPGFPFGIKCGDDTVYLLNSTTIVADMVTVPELNDGISDGGTTWGRLPDFSGSFQMTTSTPGLPNTEWVYVTTPTCNPEVVVNNRYLVEGDPLEASIRCTSGEDPANFLIQAIDLPAGANFDALNWKLSWNTSLYDAGQYGLVFEIEEPQYSSIEQAVLTIWIADAVDNAENILVDPVDYTSEWGLPVLHLFPSGELSEEYTPTTVVFDGVTYSAQMKLRGASSLYYPKNSYTIEFDDTELNAAAYGLEHRDHLVLISTFDDNSYMRQKLTYDTWRDMAAFWGESRLTPRTFFSVIYLNGSYWGLYVAADRIDDQFVKQMGLNSDGNLYKAIDHNANFYLTDVYGRYKRPLHLGYEKKEGEPADGEDGAWDDLDALVLFSGSSDDASFVAKASNWLQPDEFMDWFLFVHYLAADDSGGKNAYLYNDPTAYSFRYCPWDFNHSFGQSYLTQRISPDTYDDFQWANAVFAHFQNDEDAASILWARFSDEMEFGPLSYDTFASKLGTYVEQIDPSAQRDWDQWGESYQSYWAAYRSGTDWTDYDGEKVYLYDWLQNRETWMYYYHP